MDKIELKNNETLIFTNVIFLRKTNNKHSTDFELISGRSKRNILFECTLNNIVSFEKTFNVKLIGISDSNNHDKIVSARRRLAKRI